MARTKNPPTITQMEASIKEAQEALKTADDAGRADLETQITAQQKALADLKGQQGETYASEHDHYLALLAEKRETQLREVADQHAQVAVAGMKAHLDAEQERLDRMVAEAVERQMAAMIQAPGFKSTVSAALAGTRAARKTPFEMPDGATPGATQGYKGGAPAFIQFANLGEKGSFPVFLRALKRGDDAAIWSMQRASKALEGEIIMYGGVYAAKALAEGGGAGSAVSGPGGGVLVPPEYSTEIIDLLRPQVVLRKADPTVLTLTSPQFFQPRLAGAATAYYEGENQAIPTSQETFEQLSLAAKMLTALVPVSNLLLNDSNPSAEQVIRKDLAKVIALKEDKQFLYGTGSNTAPTGLVNQPGILSLTTATNGTAATYNMVTNFVEALDTANIPDSGKRCWFAHPKLKKMFLQVVDGYGRPIFANFNDVQNASLLSDGHGGTVRVPSLEGYPFLMTTQSPLGTTGTGTTTPLMLVDMEYVKIGQIGAMEIAVSTEATYVDTNGNIVSAFASNQSLFRVIWRHDVALDHAVAVCVENDVLYS